MAFRGTHTPESREKMSAGQKAALRNPAIMRKRLRALALAAKVRAAKPCAYPPAKRALYRKLRSQGISRAAAIVECNRPDPN